MAGEENKASQAVENLAGKTAAGGADPTAKTPEAASRNGAKDAPRETEAAGKGKNAQGQDAIELLKADHRRVEQLFAEYETATGRRKTQIVEKVCRELILHTLLEEEIFYPACREAAADDTPLDQAQVEHDSAKLLIVELLDGQADEYRDAKLKVLAEQVKHHVAGEEKPREGLFAKAQSSGVDTAELGRRIQQRKQRLQGEERSLRPSRPVSFQRLEGAIPDFEEDSMPRDYERDRDERGRFTSDDDRDRGRYAERRGGDERRYAEDDRDYRGRRRGGWFGDPEGHSEAARRGWDNPDHGPSGWYGDSRGHAEASRRGWDNPDHGPSGWYGDSRGHAEASRRGWDNPDHGPSGWYGDPEGHSEASRRGWEERGDRGRSSSRGEERSYARRDDDDDRRGWYGDPRGHAEASRRGWEERRSRDDDDRDYRARSRDDDDDRDSRGRRRGGWFGDSRGHSEAARRGR